jgi:uncharacterized protein YjiS (DUF1127 family)
MTNLDTTVLQVSATAHHTSGARTVTRAVTAVLGLLADAYRARRDAEHLKGLNDHLLRDLGIGPDQIDGVVRHGRVPRS